MKIVETRWALAERLDLTSLHFPESVEWDFGTLYGLSVCLEGESYVPLIRQASTHFFTPLPSFRDHLRAYRLDSLYAAARAIDEFALLQYREDKQRAPTLAFAQVPIIEEVLRDSGGVLLWHYQVERLYILFTGDIEGAVDFRRQILKYRDYTQAHQLKLTCGTTLENVLREREWYGRLRIAPDLRAAAALLAWYRAGA